MSHSSSANPRSWCQKIRVTKDPLPDSQKAASWVCPLMRRETGSCAFPCPILGPNLAGLKSELSPEGCISVVEKAFTYNFLGEWGYIKIKLIMLFFKNLLIWLELMAVLCRHSAMVVNLSLFHFTFLIIITSVEIQ